MTALESLHPAIRQTEEGARVLVVDDDPIALQTLQAMVAAAGYRPHCVGTVAAAERALADQDYALVLTDLYLGAGGSGYDVAELARTQRPPIPTVLLTGRPSFGAAAEAVRSRVREIVVKPVDASVLRTACDRALETARMEQRSRVLETQNLVLATVAPRMIEAKDPTTSGHAERVVSYVDHLARRCGLDPSVREELRLAALLHDVGKVAVPRSILCKQGALSQAERQVIMRHPEVGHDILCDLEGCENVRSWVLHHHEKWNGRGYPHGLSGEEVPLPGRILILAEVYDALAEARSYKSAWPVEDIVDYLRAEAGKHFDPELARMVADGLEREGRGFFSQPDVVTSQ